MTAKNTSNKTAKTAKAKAKTKTAAAKTKQRVFLVVVDECPELHQALYFAGKRAKEVNGRVDLLRCVSTSSEFKHWVGVGALMIEEARQDAEEMLTDASETLYEITGKRPIIHLREGDPEVEVIKLIDEVPEISVLVLGANTSGENTGPLIGFLTGRGAGQCRVPITIVPGNLSDEALDDVTDA
ncbi:MAG: universal stress protein [Proteobacteria bacterium]|nr:universal stress protein [Pseudomonadota bacterium]